MPYPVHKYSGRLKRECDQAIVSLDGTMKVPPQEDYALDKLLNNKLQLVPGAGIEPARAVKPEGF